MTLRRIFLMYVALMSLSAMANGDAADNAAAELEGVIESYELAYRMQSMASEVFDLGRESPQTLAMYGGDLQPTDVFARQCLLARRMAEADVRFIQVATGYHWNHHGDIEQNMPASAAQTDKPVAAVLSAGTCSGKRRKM